MEDISTPTRCIFEGSAPSSSPAPSELHQSNTHEPACPIRRIATGGNHTLVLYANGAVYAAGCNIDGRCGQDVSSSRERKERGEGKETLPSFERVVVRDPETGRRVDVFKDVSATWEGSFLVASVGDGEEVVFALGSGARGELGLGDGAGMRRAVSAVNVPGLPLRGNTVSAISSGMGHSVVVLSNGEVYGWGGARKGQLGEKVKERKIVWEPVKIEDTGFRATGAACGREFTVIMGDATAGEFVILGSKDNKWGVLADVPRLDSLTGYKGIYASWHGVYVHQHDSSLSAWGRNDRGQLPPVDIPKPKQLAIGSEHGLALLDDGTVVAFGWGEHGNCGPDTDAQGNVSGKWNKIPLTIEGANVVGIAAGCATSWIITS